MRDENALNSHIGKQLTKLQPRGLAYMKAADKFRSGVSDFLVWWQGNSFAIEVKFIKDWPSDKAKLLTHQFKPEQITFLENIDLSENGAFGLVGVDSERLMYLIPLELIPRSGNWKTGEFRHMVKEDAVLVYRFNHVEDMVKDIIYRETEDG